MTDDKIQQFSNEQRIRVLHALQTLADVPGETIGKHLISYAQDFYGERRAVLQESYDDIGKSIDALQIARQGLDRELSLMPKGAK